jgi:hypothetical protein
MKLKLLESNRGPIGVGAIALFATSIVAGAGVVASCEIRNKEALGCLPAYGAAAAIVAAGIVPAGTFEAGWGRVNPALTPLRKRDEEERFLLDEHPRAEPEPPPPPLHPDFEALATTDDGGRFIPAELAQVPPQQEPDQLSVLGPVIQAAVEAAVSTAFEQGIQRYTQQLGFAPVKRTARRD